MHWNILPNIAALICTSIAVIQLAASAPKIGGAVGKILKLLIAGIFFAVTVHAGVELAQIFGLLKEEYLMFTMGILLTIGSVFFIAAGSLAARTFRQ